jgi:hypothetical protein
MLTVRHDAELHRFVVELPDGRGELRYRRVAPGIVDLLHTEVDPALRGQGIADALVGTAVTWAREAGDRVIPTCPFVQQWFDRHPDQGDLLTTRPPRAPHDG